NGSSRSAMAETRTGRAKEDSTGQARVEDDRAGGDGLHRASWWKKPLGKQRWQTTGQARNRTTGQAWEGFAGQAMKMKRTTEQADGVGLSTELKGG
ncbi:hypothetical protein Dimus_033597, partial [Dionaea muscipula]